MRVANYGVDEQGQEPSNPAPDESSCQTVRVSFPDNLDQLRQHSYGKDHGPNDAEQLDHGLAAGCETGLCKFVHEAVYRVHLFIDVFYFSL